MSESQLIVVVSERLLSLPLAYHVIHLPALPIPPDIAPDVVIVDKLADCQTLRASRETLLILLLWEESETLPNALNGGATDVLLWPVESRLLEHRLKLLLSLQAAYSHDTNLLRAVVDHLPDYIFAKDRKGRFMFSNRANNAYLGVDSQAEVIGKTDYDFYPPERADVFRADDQTIMTYGQPMINQEIPVDYGDGSTRWYVINKVPLPAPTGETIGIVGMIRDITERRAADERIRKANQQLQELSELKSHFLLTMSHELLTPLGHILPMTDLLLQEIYGPLTDKQRERLTLIQNSGQTLHSLINDVLDLSKLQSGRMEMALEAVDFASLLSESLPEFRAVAQQKGLIFEQDIEANLPAIWGDRAAILRIITNLISNAIKFTQAGYIIIGAQPIPLTTLKSLPVEVDYEARQWVMLSIQDTGMGILTEMQQRIFDEFYQADNSATRQHAGTGLGLAICNKLVKLMHGGIWLESAPGLGSSFFVLLPAV